MKEAVAYLRVSSEAQATEGVSLDAQRAKAVAWCDLNGYRLAAVHVDAGLSGRKVTNRPGLHAALDDVCLRHGALVVYSLSRLARSTRDTLVIADRLKKARADLVSLSERIDTTSAAGAMFFRLMAVLAEFERDLVAERTRAALQHKRTLGERVGQVPFGYNVGPDGIELLENPDEQAALADMASMRRHGMSYRGIAAALTARGVSPKNGSARWSHSAVAAILGGQARDAARTGNGGEGRSRGRAITHGVSAVPAAT